VDQSPGGREEVLLSILKAFDGARRTIDVENAYYVRIPSVEAALVAAVRRGVRVRLLTNSPGSLDEPILSYAIVASAGALADAGGEVWLRRGTTLHSKFLVVDGRFAQVGSFNLHPRSHRLEGEAVVNVVDEGFAQELTAAFEADLGNAARMTSSTDVPLPTDPLGRIGWTWFPDLL
jgi:cardiolipin synthase